MNRRSTNLYLSTILASAMLFVTTGCPSTFDTYRAQGVKMLNEGRFAAAKGLFEHAHTMVPENADNLNDLGSCHALTGPG